MQLLNTCQLITVLLKIRTSMKIKRIAVLIFGLASLSGLNVTGLLKQHLRLYRNTGSWFVYLKLCVHVNKKETHRNF